MHPDTVLAQRVQPDGQQTLCSQWQEELEDFTFKKWLELKTSVSSVWQPCPLQGSRDCVIIIDHIYAIYYQDI